MKLQWTLGAAFAIVVGFVWWSGLESRASGEGVGPGRRGAQERRTGLERERSPAREGVALEPVEPVESVARSAVEDLRVPTERLPRRSHEGAPGQEASSKPTPAELARFRDYLDTTRREMRAEDAREKQRSIDKASLEMERRASRFAARRGLSDETSRKLLDILRREQDREAEYVLLWERGAEEAQLDELRRRDREESRRELLGILTSEELAELLRR